MEQQIIDPSPLSESLLFQMQEDERYRLARALQEGPGQLLANAAMELEHSLPLLATDPAQASIGLTALLHELERGLSDLKAFIADLHPSLLKELGLTATLQKYLASFQHRTGIRTDLDLSQAPVTRLPSMMETALFRIAQEAMENVREHSAATQAIVTVSRVEDKVTLSVVDNGRGFPGWDAGNGRRQLGLVTMRDRAKLLGGRLHVYSSSGRGVQLVAEIPYHENAQQPLVQKTKE